MRFDDGELLQVRLDHCELVSDAPVKMKVAKRDRQIQPTSRPNEADCQPASASNEADEDEVGDDDYEVGEILSRRSRQWRGGSRIEYRVRWQGFGEAADTWEPVDHLGGARRLWCDR